MRQKTEETAVHSDADQDYAVSEDECGHALPDAERFFRLGGFPKPYPIEWICLVLGLFLCIHYAWLMDDAYVYFRYVDNLVFLDAGLVYNRGEYVEGFSSPLWVLILIALRYLHLEFWTVVRCMGVGVFALFWALLVIINRKLSEGTPGAYIVNLPLIHLSLTYGVLCYFTSGLESPLVQLSAVAYACFLLFPFSLPLQLFLGLSPLIRHELLVPCLIVFVWFLITQKRVPWVFFSSCLVFGMSYLLFRIYYYADLFPNTFYLKDDVAIKQGLLYVKDTVVPYFSHYILLFSLLMFVFLRIWRKDREKLHTIPRLMMLILGLSVAAYVVKIGGDPRHYRYLAFPYCIIMCATGGLIERLLANFRLQRYTRSVFLASLFIAVLTLTRYSRQLEKHPVSYDERHNQIDRIKDPAVHRLRKAYTPPLWDWNMEEDTIKRMKEFRQNHERGYYENVITEGICSTAYRAFESQVIHNCGLAEPFLARTVMASERPAHKAGLKPLADDIVEIRKRDGFQKGVFRKAAESGNAPAWIRNNLAAIEKIEQKAFNRHDLFENVEIAFGRTGKINPETD